MIHVVGNWELGWSAPLTEAPLWSLPLRDFGVIDWWMWPISGITNNERGVTLHERATFDEILDELGDIPRVFIEPSSEVCKVEASDLIDFDHPDDCAYIFGGAHYNPVLARHRPGESIVRIRTKQNAGVLWPHQVLVTILHDRLIKEN